MRSETANLKNVRIRDTFWDRYTRLVTGEVIPYQWKVLNDETQDGEPSHAIRNFRIAAGLEEGDFYGFVFQDSDVAKWLEAVAYSLAAHPDAELEARADDVIALLGKAQQPDGYLDTYFIIREPGTEFENLREGHELYCAGHLIEAGCAYYQATGKRELLEICRKMADHIVEMFAPELAGNTQDGPADSKVEHRLSRAVPGHEEIELALIRLYELTGGRKYLDMAVEFLNRRGQAPGYLEAESERPGWKPVFVQLPERYRPDYAQADEPVRRQKTARGHAVRAVYLYCAMADAAYYTKDETLMDACRTIYENMVNRQMYITGGIGSSGHMERFTTDYDLPNAMNYAESCASIGLALFCRRMAQITHEAKYMDTAELALYNTVTAGIAMDGKSFFYVNPLAVWPAACMEGVSRSHVKPVRQKWFACACCPPNIARTLASLGSYCYFTDSEGFWVNLFVGGEAVLPLGGAAFRVETHTDFPYGNRWKMDLAGKEEGPGSASGKIRLRIPEYVRGVQICVRKRDPETGEMREMTALLASEELKTAKERSLGQDAAETSALQGGVRLAVEKGYAVLSGAFGAGDTVEMCFDMPPVFMRANPQVRADAGRAALKKGPLVYCLEQTDNGENLEQLLADCERPVTERFDPDLLGGTLVLEAEGYRYAPSPEEIGKLYSPAAKPAFVPAKLTFVPYAYWGNRQSGEMIVWVREKL